MYGPAKILIVNVRTLSIIIIDVFIYFRVFFTNILALIVMTQELVYQTSASFSNQEILVTGKSILHTILKYYLENLIRLIF